MNENSNDPMMSIMLNCATKTPSPRAAAPATSTSFASPTPNAIPTNPRAMPSTPVSVRKIRRTSVFFVPMALHRKILFAFLNIALPSHDFLNICLNLRDIRSFFDLHDQKVNIFFNIQHLSEPGFIHKDDVIEKWITRSLQNSCNLKRCTSNEYFVSCMDCFSIASVSGKTASEHDFALV